MANNSPGIYPRIEHSITPKSKSTIENIRRNSDQFSYADLILLNKEIDNLKKQAILDEDKELELEANLLSQSLASKKRVNNSKHSFQYED